MPPKFFFQWYIFRSSYSLHFPIGEILPHSLCNCCFCLSGSGKTQAGSFNYPKNTKILQNNTIHILWAEFNSKYQEPGPF